MLHNKISSIETNFKQHALTLALAATCIFGSTAALAGTVGGSVTAINTLTQTDVSNITVGSSTAGAANGQTDVTVASGQIDNNNVNGWKLTVVSGNLGKLKLGAGGAGREIAYTNIALATTGGTLGTGLTSPVATKAVTGVGGSAIFNTGTAVGTPGTATTATVAYLYTLKIGWSSDLTLLAGSYTDTLTLTLANDS